MATDESKLWEISNSAFDAEENQRFDEAFKLHSAAIEAFERFTHDGKLLTTDPVRLAKMQIKVHEKRRTALQAAKSNAKAPLLILPTLASCKLEITNYVSRGKKDIGTVGCPLPLIREISCILYS
jgi:hypothetical protein